MVCRTDVCCPNPAWTGPSPQDSFNANDQHGGFHQWGPVAICILDGYWKIPWKILESPMKQIPLQVDDDWGSPHDFAFSVVSPIFTSSDWTVSRIYGSSDVVAGSLVQPVPTVLQARFRAWSMMVNVSLWWYHDDIPNSWVMSRTFSSGFTRLTQGAHGVWILDWCSMIPQWLQWVPTFSNSLWQTAVARSGFDMVWRFDSKAGYLIILIPSNGLSIVYPMLIILPTELPWTMVLNKSTSGSTTRTRMASWNAMRL